MPSTDHRRLKKLCVFMRYAEDLASLATCCKRSIGCVIADPDLTEVLAIGFNGRLHGEPNDSCRGADPCYCVHAELNACLKLRSTQAGLLLFVTERPCIRCAQAIIQTRQIAKVYLSNRIFDTPTDGVSILLARGITVDSLP